MQQCGGRFLLTADHGNAEDMAQVCWRMHDSVLGWWCRVAVVLQTGKAGDWRAPWRV